MHIDIVELNNQRRFPSKSDTQLISQHPPPIPHPPPKKNPTEKNKTNKKENNNKIQEFLIVNYILNGIYIR